jgi:hypothetical protein
MECGRSVFARLFSDFHVSSLLLHQFGEFFPAQTVFVYVIASGKPFDIAIADQQGTQLGAVGFYVDLDVFVKDKFAVNA